MRKLISLFLVTSITLTSASCANYGGQPQIPVETIAPAENINKNQVVKPSTLPSQAKTQDISISNQFLGKIGIATGSYSVDFLTYCSAQHAVSKYGEEKIDHITWPEGYTTDTKPYADRIERFYHNRNVNVIITCGPQRFLNEIFEELSKGSKDFLNISTIPYTETTEIGATKLADLTDMILAVDEISIGQTMVQQAHAMGAKTIVNYSYPPNMSSSVISLNNELMQQESLKLGLNYIDATFPDPSKDINSEDAEKFFEEDVSKMIGLHGKDTAFIATATYAQVPLIVECIENGAIYLSPFSPSPYRGFPEALGLNNEYGEPPVEDIISKIETSIGDNDMLGRLSTWPVDPNMMFTEAAIEYAIKWINGEVPKEGIDVEVLTKLMEDYAGVPVYLTPYTDPETGETYENYLMMRMDYITFE